MPSGYHRSGNLTLKKGLEVVCSESDSVIAWLESQFLWVDSSNIVKRYYDDSTRVTFFYRITRFKTSHNQGVTRLDGARGKKQVWCPRVRNRGFSEANVLYWWKYLWRCWYFSALPYCFGNWGIVPSCPPRYATGHNEWLKSKSFL